MHHKTIPGNGNAQVKRKIDETNGLRNNGIKGRVCSAAAESIQSGGLEVEGPGRVPRSSRVGFLYMAPCSVISALTLLHGCQSITNQPMKHTALLIIRFIIEHWSTLKNTIIEIGH